MKYLTYASLMLSMMFAGCQAKITIINQGQNTATLAAFNIDQLFFYPQSGVKTLQSNAQVTFEMPQGSANSASVITIADTSVTPPVFDSVRLTSSVDQLTLIWNGTELTTQTTRDASPANLLNRLQDSANQLLKVTP